MWSRNFEDVSSKVSSLFNICIKEDSQKCVSLTDDNVVNDRSKMFWSIKWIFKTWETGWFQLDMSPKRKRVLMSSPKHFLGRFFGHLFKIWACKCKRIQNTWWGGVLKYQACTVILASKAIWIKVNTVCYLTCLNARNITDMDVKYWEENKDAFSECTISNTLLNAMLNSLRLPVSVRWWCFILSPQFTISYKTVVFSFVQYLSPGSIQCTRCHR